MAFKKSDFNIHIALMPGNHVQDHQFSSAMCFANTEQKAIFQRANKVRTRDRRCTQTSRTVQGKNEVEASQGNKSLALQLAVYPSGKMAGLRTTYALN